MANTLALKEAGIFENPPEMDDGLIVTDENGVPTGMLNERARFLIYDILTKIQQGRTQGFILDYQKDLLKAGLTTVQTDDFKLWDASIKDILDAYRELDKEGKLKVRFIQQLHDKYAGTKLLSRRRKRDGEGSEFFKIGAFKLLPDGSLGGKTAALREPYANDGDNRGIFVYDEREFYELAEKAHTSGLQLAIHAIGDRTMDVILNCYEELAAKYPKGRSEIQDHTLPDNGRRYLRQVCQRSCSGRYSAAVYKGRHGGGRGTHRKRKGCLHLITGRPCWKKEYTFQEAPTLLWNPSIRCWPYTAQSLPQIFKENLREDGCLIRD